MVHVFLLYEMGEILTIGVPILSGMEDVLSKIKCLCESRTSPDFLKDSLLIIHNLYMFKIVL